MAMWRRVICSLVVGLLIPIVALAAVEDITEPRLTKESRGHVNVLYWPNKNLGFGHVALEVFFPDNNYSSPDIYLSWARGNDRVVDDDIHQQEPKLVRLPIEDVKRFLPFVRWTVSSTFCDESASSYGASYSVITNNCAHAVLRGLKELGFSSRVSTRRPALTPKRVYRLAKELRREDRMREKH